MTSHVRRPRLLFVLLLATAACQHVPVADPAAASPTFRVDVRLPDDQAERPRAVSLHLATPRAASSRPLVVHLTGDGGAHGLDLELFTALTRWGYPVALLSSPAWAATLVGARSTPEGLARDVDRIARAAAKAAGRTEDAPFVLFGLSRGAGLAVEAAGETPLRGRLVGVVVLGLCGKEEYVWRDGRSGRPYADLRRLGPLPLEVIQSTHDRYMGAAAARAAFGPDTPSRALHPIEARSHTFVEGRDALLVQLEASLRRVAVPGEPPPQEEPAR
jgi:hypothetical protein